MAHFAKVINGIVETVHVVDQDYIDSGKLGGAGGKGIVIIRYQFQ